MTKTKTIWGREVSPKVGTFIKPDGWKFGERLIAGDSFSTFRLPTGLAVVTSIACEIEITGRELRRAAGMSGMVRVKITFPGDGEPDTVCGGFMSAD